MPTLTQRPPDTAAVATRLKRRGPRLWQVALAVLAAFLLLAGLIVLLAWALPLWPRPPMRRGAAAPISLTLQPPEPSPTPGLHKTETVPQQPDYMRTPDDRASDTPPPDPKFISDKDTLAASEKPPEDLSKPLPSQDGKEISAFDFETNPYIPGKEAHDNLLAAAEPAAAAAPTPPPTNAQPSPSPEPLPTPEPSPSPGDFLTLRRDPVVSNTPPAPTPSAKPPSTPPIKDLLAAQAARVARENPSVNSNTGVRQPPGYQPQSIQTKMSGSVDNHGKSSVAALGTALGRYEKSISDAIGARWYFLVDEHMSNLVQTGEVTIHFVVTRSGKIIKTNVSGKTPNSALASVSLEAITNAELPPIPPDVVALLPGGQLEVDYMFSMY